MRIGFDAKRFFHNRTGLGNYSRDVVRILLKFTDITEVFLYNTREVQPPKLPEKNRITLRFPSAFWRVFHPLWRMWAVRFSIAQDRPEIFHGLSAEIPLGIGRGMVKTVVTIHDLIFLTHPSQYRFFDRLIYRLKIRYAVQKADAVIAISKQTKQDILRFFKVPPEKIHVIYQGCNEVFKQPCSQQEIDQTRKKFDLPDRFVLCVGTIQERKNALGLVKAVEGTPYPLLLIGSEKRYGQKVRDYISQAGMQKQVRILSGVNMEDLARIYQCATLFCYPSLYEGFGIPIIEALFSKVPVITSKDGCFPEAGGPGSIYVNPTDIDALRSKIIKVMEDNILRERMITSGYEYVQRFTDEKVAENLYSFYKSLN